VKSIEKELLQTYRKYYEREREIHANLSHPNVVKFYDYAENSEGMHIFLEYCARGSLFYLIEATIPEELALSFFRQLLEGMAYLNSQSTQ
jgi:serine/threonine protein kinase